MWGELFVTRGHRRGPGSESREALARVNAAEALQEEEALGWRGCSTAPHRGCLPPTPRTTLLEELARVRSQPDCLSFSEDVGSWEGASSVFRMEAGGSEGTCERHKSHHWHLQWHVRSGRGLPASTLKRVQGLYSDAQTPTPGQAIALGTPWGCHAMTSPHSCRRPRPSSGQGLQGTAPATALSVR